ncbi:MAG: FtsH protease activity modulator HflK [gamma proteobacterium symbiont of Lucinoma myriamae]|nr:FtsH protease activity modulator HflK [gamma proteobacterium symbiont of Lucinoma myriamae]MCU7819813.1 FtsH protease activity modulator HflK [gamma proteobacterium symbiont of Lucinoma myriamae]MCU7831579.1 FtsH protease activity modulator HflK [gamma proteobacterium symbiont of Lucinoma myriamae]
MAWNEPGGPKNNDPWGNKNNNDKGPPDLDEVIKNLNDKIGKLFGGNKKSGGNGSGGKDSGSGTSFTPGQPPTILLVIIGIVAIGIWAMSGIYTVDQGKKAVVLQFGEAFKTVEAGIQWYAPGIQSYHLVDVSASRSLNIGGSQHEAHMLTKDENIVEIKVAVQYKVSDAEHFLFNVRDPGLVLRQVSESAVREIVGKNEMDFILTEGRSAIASKIGVLAQEILDRYKTGLLITRFTLQSAKAPAQVQDAFEDVNAAREDKERYINEAQAYSNDVIPKARGVAARQVAEAQAYNGRVIAESEGETARFLSVLTEYEKAPEVTRDRLYLDAMENVYSKTSKVMIDTKGSNNLLYLPLDKMMRGTINNMPSSSDTGAGAGETVNYKKGSQQSQYRSDQFNTDNSRARPSIRERR